MVCLFKESIILSCSLRFHVDSLKVYSALFLVSLFPYVCGFPVVFASVSGMCVELGPLDADEGSCVG